MVEENGYFRDILAAFELKTVGILSWNICTRICFALMNVFRVITITDGLKMFAVDCNSFYSFPFLGRSSLVTSRSFGLEEIIVYCEKLN